MKLNFTTDLDLLALEETLDIVQKLNFTTDLDLLALEETLDIVQLMASDVTEEDLEVIELAIAYYLGIAAENKAADQFDQVSENVSEPEESTPVTPTIDWLTANPWIKWNGGSDKGPREGAITADTKVEFLLFADIKSLYGVYPHPDFKAKEEYRVAEKVKDLYWGHSSPPSNWQVAYYRVAK